MFSEDLLQFIWQFGFIEKRNELKTIDGKPLQIIKPGTRNTNAGPDFLNAKIQIGDTLWAGNIELHLASSDWLKHKHDENAAYEKLILHVVYENDVTLQLNFPTIEIKNHIRPSLLSRYEELMRIDRKIPCQAHLKDVSQLRKTHMQERVLVERLQRKTTEVHQLLQKTNNHWEEVFYILIARNFGLKINQEPFEKIASNTPLKLFAKHKNNLLQIEALLFGQAGFLSENVADDYFSLLKKEYAFFQKLYGLKNIPLHQISFLRLRPANFPTVRLAQFASLLHRSQHLFSKILETQELNNIFKLLEVVASKYWDNHYRFGTESEVSSEKKLGRSFIELLIINTIIPTVFIYGKATGEQVYCNKALRWLEELKPEKNTITEDMRAAGFSIKNAKDSQAIIELKNNYCDSKQCLQCGIGYAILN